MMVDSLKDDFFNASGAALNRSRMTTSYNTSGTVDSDVTGHSLPVNINLFNMEDPKFEDSKYVLTSPRSLEACSRLGLKPVELLHKPLAEFEDELLPKGVLLRTVYAVYDDHEADRQRKMRCCREEREAIIKEDLLAKSTFKSPLIGSPQHLTTLAKKSSLKESLNNKEAAASDLDHAEPGDLNTGSIQRQRTAWTTSVGHQRITKDELNQRAKELYEEGTQIEKTDPLKKSAPRNKKTKIKRQQSSAQSRSQSLSDLQPSMWCHTSTVGADARPITDPKLRSKLRRSRTLNSKINPKDQKILQLMMNKREEELSSKAQREVAKVAWEEQRKDVTKSGTLRRKSCSEVNSLREAARKHLTMNGLKHDEEHEDIAEKRLLTPYELSHKRWAQHFQKQLEIREQQYREKKMQELQRKRSQELSLKAQESEMNEYQEMVQQKLEHDIKRATSKREAKEHEETLQRKLKSYKAKLQHEEKMKEIKRKNEKEIEKLASSVEVKHVAAEDKYKQMLMKREKELRLNQILRDEKLLKSRKTREQMEAELEEWHQQLQDYRKMMESKAAEVVTKTQAVKSRKAHDERVIKEKTQRVNFKKVLEEEQARRHEMEEILSLKDSRSQLIQQQREAHIQQSRSIALASQQLREEIREQYADVTFDKMAKQAQLEARIGAGINTATKNLSKVVLS